METKVCKHCGTSFPITDKDLEFYEKVSPTFGGKKYSIPTPTLCPDCRQQRRLSLRNARKLYKRKCDATRKDIVSIYSPDKPYTVYHQDYWWSDKWNPLDYGRAFDFGKPFFEQVGELINEIPHINVVNVNPENSEYTNGGVGNKNCYMLFLASNNQECYYGHWILDSSNLLDCYNSIKSNDCYQCIDIHNSNTCFYSERLKNCTNCYSCFDCIGCNNCIDCNGQTNKEFMIRNISVTPDKFYDELKRNNRKFPNKSGKVVKFADILNCENVIGDNISNSKDSSDIYMGREGENIKYAYGFLDMKDSYDVDSQAYDSYKNYEMYGVENINTSLGIYLSANISHTYYSLYCFSSSHLFGCIGLRNTSYCILNKQYTKEEYETLVPKIIEHMMKTGEWGEFFPASLSPFGYNETVAQEYFPLSKEEATKDGIFNWSDYEPPFPKVEKIIKANMLTDDISKIPDDILNWAIECEVTGKPFRIIKQELEFYRKHYLPIPRRHPDQRHLDRMALRNPRKLFERACDKCHKDIITTYSPERPEIVYCETCYNKEVIG